MAGGNYFLGGDGVTKRFSGGDSGPVFRRGLAARIVRREIAARSAAEAIGPIEAGIEVFGLSKGQFSLIDIIEHCLKASGPADVVIST
jgi:hypothetical protein